ncbi:LuxR C-terminal-related transcriptional regulator [Kaistella jeonii]|nr:LuxR C-terminal-related transcriptional regulator [Kaistella jeonii]SFC04556.1 regulatory protein, luxR family [Kaistella jeonii]VEI96724.1 Putative HTH-type transcriptional regulator yhjB [Kaistella jeonii]
MNKSLIFFIFFFGILNSQHLNLKEIEKEVQQNNRVGKHLTSQKQLMKLLEEENCTMEEQAKINLLLATTFRSIDDYGSSINYLKKSQKAAENLSTNDSLKMNIAAEMAFTYFDNRDYDSAEKIIKNITEKKYVNLKLTDKAYIIMQIGYINYLKKNYRVAELQYLEALGILKKNSTCNQPVVMVKQMQLYAKLKIFDKVDQVYEDVMTLADSCKIIKYKIYATEEIKNIYVGKNNQQKVFLYGARLDSLNLKYNRDHNLSEMHLKNQTSLEEENESEKSSRFLFILLAFFLGLLLMILGIYYFRRSKLHKKETIVFEDEIKRIKEELKLYSTMQFSQNQMENDILNSSQLNRRQKELLQMVSEGLSNKEIAEKLSITEATVKYHLRNIYAILDIKNRKDILAKLSKK